MAAVVGVVSYTIAVFTAEKTQLNRKMKSRACSTRLWREGITGRRKRKD